MKAVKELLKFGLSIPVNFDRLVAWLTKNRPWGKYQKGKTISWGFGAEEAEVLYVEWILHHRICNTLPYIDLKAHPLGQFSESICTAIQSLGSGRKRFHGLECFLNDKTMLAKFEKDYPGIEGVVRQYLKSQGVKVS